MDGLLNTRRHGPSAAGARPPESGFRTNDISDPLSHGFHFRHRSPEALLWLAAAAGVLLMSQPTWNQWVTWGLSGAILLIIFVRQVLEPALRAFRMRTPYTGYFRLTGNGAVRPTELRLDSNSRQHMQINRVARLSFVEHELIVGFEGDPDKRPFIIEPENKFVKKGSVNKEYYVDVKDNIHIVGSRHRTRTNTYADGFKIQTRSPGRYSVKIRSITDSGESQLKNSLTVIVSDTS